MKTKYWSKLGLKKSFIADLEFFSEIFEIIMVKNNNNNNFYYFATFFLFDFVACEICNHDSSYIYSLLYILLFSSLLYNKLFLLIKEFNWFVNKIESYSIVFCDTEKYINRYILRKYIHRFLKQGWVQKQNVLLNRKCDRRP